ncbi:NCAH-like protein [Mya arenaria]|uniref:NCAH-like protein n=1 Tax=Mya arenaria TaxID=6604 RepID=A0ABY7FQ46_MYAAR|nr:neurocalcin homolog [Mya arenaria]WAR22999.1 NCAH-like protein [Mya arenaria]
MVFENLKRMRSFITKMTAKGQKRKIRQEKIDELQNEVSFSSDEIKDWFYEYNKRLGEGHKELTKEEFKDVYNSIFAGDASEFAEHVFRTFDRDGNGTVDFKEFLIGLCVSGSDDTAAKLSWAFKMYDIDGDGYISRQEMRSIMSAIYKMTELQNPDETGSQASAEDLADRFFEDFDTNKDGLVSWAEFRVGATNDQTIISLLECNPDTDPE